ncbi:MAG: DUF1385 domain-containing protein [Lachnospiraceae bacterium]|nr:DUF1385 domain-containing protein [Lachnospiraceae bacterium]
MAKKTICMSGIGGQAVLEGVMMKNKEDCAVAIRKPDGEIDVEVTEYHGVLHGHMLTRIPFIRGVFSFMDSLILGTRAINHSTQFYEEEEPKDTAVDRFFNRIFGDAKAEKVLTGIVMVFSFAVAIGLFIILPYYLSTILSDYILNSSLLALVEGIIRLIIFLLYVVAITLMKDIRRLYMYHGAEHKCINCIEHGHELTVANVKKASRFHRRCGTSFLLFVMMVSIVLFMFIRVDSPVLRIVLRLLLIPVIAGISFEIIRLAGRTDNVFVRILSAPGLLLQRLTTKEPDDTMIEVGIRSVEAVFDWKAFLSENFGLTEETDTDEQGQI